MTPILHLDMDAFFAAIEERDNPQFAGKPIVVGADPKDGHGRGVVSTANYEARKYGIKSAMPISWAYRACPSAVFLPVEMKRYAGISRNIIQTLRQYADKVEPISIDEAYFEQHSFNAAEITARKIKDEIFEKESLTCSVGIGPNKLVAKIASDHNKPNGLVIVQPNEVQKFLDPKPAQAIPGIGPKTLAVLQKNWQVKTIQDLRKIDKKALISAFGIHGEHIWQMARAVDNRQIEEQREIKSIGRQTTFSRDLVASGPIVDTAMELLKEVFEDAKTKNLKAKTLTVVVRYSWFETHTSQESQNKPLDLKTAKKLTLKLLIPYLGSKKVRLVGVRLSSFS